nr:hypothetical protein [Tanacetum cinerariifolium]
GQGPVEPGRQLRVGGVAVRGRQLLVFSAALAVRQGHHHPHRSAYRGTGGR